MCLKRILLAASALGEDVSSTPIVIVVILISIFINRKIDMWYSNYGDIIYQETKEK